MMKMTMLAIAKHRIRAIPLAIPLARSLCAANTASGDYKPLYSRLSESSLSVDETMSEWLKEGKSVNGADLSKIIWKLTTINSFNTALELTCWMENKGVEMSISCQARHITLTFKIKGIEMAEKYFFGLSEDAKNEKTYGALLNCYCVAKMEGKAIELFEEMKDLKFASNPIAYNNIMTLYHQLGKPQMVFIYYQEMRAAKILPDKLTRDFLCYFSLNDIMSVDKVIEEMKEAKMTNSSTYFEMATYFNSKGAYQKTVATLKKAEQVMVMSERQTFYSLIGLYAEAGNISDVIRIWKLLKTSFRRVTSTCYCNFLNALEILGDMDGMKHCFEEWESKCKLYRIKEPNLKVPNLMMDAYLRKGMVTEAEILRKKYIKKVFGSDLTKHNYDPSIYQAI